jgi:hypothetical protein
MVKGVINVGRNFWNIRGSFKVASVIDIGTQTSLVKCEDGDFVLLDTCALSGDQKAEIDRLTRNGKLLKAILHLHPFHTVSAGLVHDYYPEALLYGTSRHKEIWPTLPWQELTTDDPELHDLFSDDLEFSVPDGVDFISANGNVHFASVIVYHPLSRTIHVDDTLMFVTLPAIMAFFGMRNRLEFHPTLALALERRAGAADDFRQWAKSLVEDWGMAENLCAAHTKPLLAEDYKSETLARRLSRALRHVRWVLRLHRLRYGRAD